MPMLIPVVPYPVVILIFFPRSVLVRLLINQKEKKKTEERQTMTATKIRFLCVLI